MGKRIEMEAARGQRADCIGPAPASAHGAGKSTGWRWPLTKGALVAVLLLSVVLPFANPGSAGAGGNVGMVRDFETGLFDVALNFVPGSHCQFTHRTQVEGGLQDRMHCKLGPGAVLPKRKTTLTTADIPRLRYVSDYALLTTGEREVATTWEVDLTPGGTFHLIAFFAAD